MSNNNGLNHLDTVDDEIVDVIQSGDFRKACITSLVGAVVAWNSDSTIAKAAGMGALLYGGFKLFDAIKSETDK